MGFDGLKMSKMEKNTNIISACRNAVQPMAPETDDGRATRSTPSGWALVSRARPVEKVKLNQFSNSQLGPDRTATRRGREKKREQINKSANKRTGVFVCAFESQLFGHSVERVERKLLAVCHIDQRAKIERRAAG